MSEMKDMILDVTERMFKDIVEKDLVDQLEEGNWAESLWNLLLENGITAVMISEKNGGAGGDIDDLLNIVRLTGKYAAPVPFMETTFSNLLLEYVFLLPTEGVATYRVEQDQAFTLEENRISGTAYNIPWGRYAQHLVTITSGINGHELVLVDLQNATIETSVNLAGEPRDTIKFKNAAIVQSSGTLTSIQLQHITKLETAFKLALITGAVDKINELTVQYTKERQQFGRPIHRFQLVQQHLVQLAGENAVMQAAFNNLSAALQKELDQNEVAYARVRAEDAITQVTTIAHQVLAAIGTTHEHALQQYTRRLWAWRDEGTDSHYWNDVIATDLLKNSGDNLWSYLTENKGKVQR